MPIQPQCLDWRSPPIQAERNQDRQIRVFDEFVSKVSLGIRGMESLEKSRSGKGSSRAQVVEGDALDPRVIERSKFNESWRLIVTSPPYCRSVEYSRRHRLELYWLGLLSEPQQSELSHRYIGRGRVRQADWDEEVDFDVPGLNETIEKIQEVSGVKARTVRHYFYSMDDFLKGMAARLARQGRMVIVIGDSICCGVRVPTADYIAALGRNHLNLRVRFSYALRNHYMQYGLWNGAGIRTEHVLTLEPKNASRGN